MPAKAYACKHCQRAFGNNKHAYSIHAKSGCPEKPGKQKTEEVPVLLLPPPIEDIVEVESVNLNAIESEEVEESDELERDHDYVSFGKKICNGRRTNYPTMTPELAQIAARTLEDLSQLQKRVPAQLYRDLCWYEEVYLIQMSKAKHKWVRGSIEEKNLWTRQRGRDKLSKNQRKMLVVVFQLRLDILCVRQRLSSFGTFWSSFYTELYEAIGKFEPIRKFMPLCSKCYPKTLQIQQLLQQTPLKCEPVILTKNNISIARSLVFRYLSASLHPSTPLHKIFKLQDQCNKATIQELKLKIQTVQRSGGLRQSWHILDPDQYQASVSRLTNQWMTKVRLLLDQVLQCDKITIETAFSSQVKECLPIIEEAYANYCPEPHNRRTLTQIENISALMQSASTYSNCLLPNNWFRKRCLI